MLATANPLFSSSNSSFLLQATNPSPPIKLQSLATPFTTFSPNGKFTLANFAKASRFLAPVGFPLTKHLLVQCSCLKLPSILRSELGLIYSFFAEMGFNEKESGLLLEQNPALKSASFDSIRAHVLLLESVGIKGVELYHLIDKSPDVLTAKEIVPLIHFVLNDLEGKVEPAQLRRLLIATVPRFLAGFDEKVKLLIKRGIPQEKIVHVLNNVNLTKALSLKSIEEIEKTVTYLSRFGGVDIIVRRPMILNFDLDTQLIPRVELLKEISGGDEDATGIVLHKLPAILSYNFFCVSKCGYLTSAWHSHSTWETDWLRWAHIKKSNINREVRLQNLLLEEQNQMIWIGQKSNITANSLNRAWMEAVGGQESLDVESNILICTYAIENS
ncbi:hypothetical protein NC653_034170 [Populus alba x Populus x berolinensis]|uniref:Uncharacterized protein n=1 Tax=Populus alba x Populus x berolinensis TaxID=444605 RepID=A0AAD6LLX3_9ROSI|nr:hypothetical protein NC653_034170 [Populus alba x Populus x berolinensis]